MKQNSAPKLRRKEVASFLSDNFGFAATDDGATPAGAAAVGATPVGKAGNGVGFVGAAAFIPPRGRSLSGS